MRKQILFLLFLPLLSFGQDDSEIIVPSYGDKYSDFAKQLESGQTDINYQDFRVSYIQSPQFKLRNDSVYNNLMQVVYSGMQNMDFPKIIKATKEMLSMDYTSMFAHMRLQQTYKKMGDTLNYEKHHDIEFGLMKSILGSGDARSCETARFTVQKEEIYFLLDIIDAEVLKESKDYSRPGICYKFKVRTDTGKRNYCFYIDEYRLLIGNYKYE